MSKEKKYEKYVIYDDDSESGSESGSEEKKSRSSASKGQGKKTQTSRKTYRKKPTAAQLKQAEMLKELEELKSEFTKLKPNTGKSRIMTQGHTIKQDIIKDEKSQESIIKSDYIRF
jgi:hypothetical protein